MRLMSLNTPLLAMTLSFLAEVLHVVCFFVFGRYGAFGPASAGTALIVYFHRLGEAVATFFVPHDTGFITAIGSFVIIAGIGLFQWFIVFFLSIGAYRRFCRRAV